MSNTANGHEKDRWVARVLGIAIGDVPARPANAYADPGEPMAEDTRPPSVYAAPEAEDRRNEDPADEDATERPAFAYAAPDDAPDETVLSAGADAAPGPRGRRSDPPTFADAGLNDPPAAPPASAYATFDGIDPGEATSGGPQHGTADEPAAAAGLPPPAPPQGSMPRYSRPPAPPPAPSVAALPQAQVMRQFDPARASFGKEIKGGGFGLVSWLDTTQPGVPPLVIKVPHTEETRRELEHEAAFYAKAGEHPNVARCYGMQEVQGQQGLVLEGIKGRDMAGTIAILEKLRTGDAATLKASGLDKQLSQEAFVGTLQYMMTQMLSGLAHLEAQGVIHNDIRPDNIMCDQTTGAVKIVDFGLAKTVGDLTRGKAPIRQGSVAPEFASPGALTGKHDVFGAGEAVRRSMEGDQFRYHTGKAQKDLDYADARAFARPDAAGNARRALSPAGPPELLDERMAKLDGRVTGLLADPAFRDTAAGVALGTAVPHAQEKLDAAQTLAEAEDIVRALEAEVSRAEAQAAAAGGAPQAGDRWDKLYQRLGTLMAEPFIKGTPAMADLVKQQRSLARIWREQASLSPEQREAELDKVEARLRHDEGRLRKTGQFGAATDYTRFVNWAMNPDPTQRPTAADALQHPFLADRLLDDASAQAVLMSVLGSEPILRGGGSDSDSDSDSWSANDSGSASGGSGSAPRGGVAIEPNSASGSASAGSDVWERSGGNSASGSAAPSV